MTSYALLLDSGVLIAQSRSRASAVIKLNNWNESRRQCLDAGVIVSPRRCVALVKITPKGKANANANT